jgi:hypothetical protein
MKGVLPYIYVYYDWNINKFVVFSIPGNDECYEYTQNEELEHIRHYSVWGNIVLTDKSVVNCLSDLCNIINRYKASNRLYINKKDIMLYYMILEGEELIEVYNDTLDKFYGNVML